MNSKLGVVRTMLRLQVTALRLMADTIEQLIDHLEDPNPPPPPPPPPTTT